MKELEQGRRTVDNLMWQILEEFVELRQNEVIKQLLEGGSKNVDFPTADDSVVINVSIGTPERGRKEHIFATVYNRMPGGATKIAHGAQKDLGPVETWRERLKT